MPLRLLQHPSADGTHAVIAADDTGAFFIPDVASVRALASRAIANGVDLATAVAASGRDTAADSRPSWRRDTWSP